MRAALDVLRVHTTTPEFLGWTATVRAFCQAHQDDINVDTADSEDCPDDVHSMARGLATRHGWTRQNLSIAVAFIHEYIDVGPESPVNEARGGIDAVYNTVRGLAELYGWTDADVASVVPPESIQAFLDTVQVLCEARPGPGATAGRQRAFWTRRLPRPE